MQPGVTLIIGKSFTGKTARLLHELRKSPRVCLADPKCAQLAGLKGWHHLWPEWNGARWNSSSLPDFFGEHLGRGFRVVVHVRHSFREQLDSLCFLLRHVKRLTLAVDEVGLFAPPGPAQVLSTNITSVIVSGRHEGISFVATVQRPSMVHKTALSQATRMLIYRVTEQNDLDVLSGYLPRDFVAAIPFLPDHVCADWQDGREPFFDYSLRGKLGGLLPREPAQMHI